jgi:hypothetical protein
LGVNKIEGTLILKLAMAKRLKVKKNLLENQKNQSSSKKILQKIPSKNGQRISSKKFVKKVLKIVKKFKKTSKN